MPDDEVVSDHRRINPTPTFSLWPLPEVQEPPPELKELSRYCLLEDDVSAVFAAVVVDVVVVVVEVVVASNLKNPPSSPKSSLFVLGLSVCRNPSRKFILATTPLLPAVPLLLPERSRSEADNFRSIELGINFGLVSAILIPGCSLTTGELGRDMVFEQGSDPSAG